MIKKYKKFLSSDNNVIKYVFEFNNVITECVLYKYPDYNTRTVLCISVQSGCPVGCSFCGTGSKFVRNLTINEIVSQVDFIFEDIGLPEINSSCAKLQIMFMSMGEPFLNYDNVEDAILILNYKYQNAQLLVSTIGPKDEDSFMKFLYVSQEINKIGLQFSIHHSTDERRNQLIPYKCKMTLLELRNYGLIWWKTVDRNPYCNYCIDGTNNTIEDFERLMKLFPACAFNFTFSVICSPDENMKDNYFRNIEMIKSFEQLFINKGYNTRIFNPAGQDDIGGGCGQLWYVQKYMKERK